ncbi:MAG: PTS glucose transporter subunit IIA [Peptococcaceae bacterium]|nr:PTS glucose transporter subunit IIA [Peptococcaceae bacterium]
MLKKLKEMFGLDRPVVLAPPPLTLLVPLAGRAIPLAAVADEVFAKNILGEGAAIIPSEGRLFSPVNGTVARVFDTLHALAIISNEGLEVLLHVGLETVALNGEYYESFVRDGDIVRAGQLLLRFDLGAIQAAGYDPVTPVVLTNQACELLKLGEIAVGEPLLKAMGQPVGSQKPNPETPNEEKPNDAAG